MAAGSSASSPNFGKVIKQQEFPIPDLTIKDLLAAIPYVNSA